MNLWTRHYVKCSNNSAAECNNHLERHLVGKTSFLTTHFKPSIRFIIFINVINLGQVSVAHLCIFSPSGSSHYCFFHRSGALEISSDWPSGSRFCITCNLVQPSIETSSQMHQCWGSRFRNREIPAVPKTLLHEKGKRFSYSDVQSTAELFEQLR